MAADQAVLHLQLGIDRLTHRDDGKVEPIALPLVGHARPARNKGRELVDIVGYPLPGFNAAKLMGQVDVDGLCAHVRRSERPLVSFQAAVHYTEPMRSTAVLVLSLGLAAPAFAQWQPVPAPRPPLTLPAPAPFQHQWNPVAEYVSAGQAEPGYRSWVLAQPWRASWVRQFHDYLSVHGVSYVAPSWQLLRTASDWQRCGADPFEVPPAAEWPNIVNTLRYVRDHVVPAVGPVEPVSVFRNAALNRCAGGAPESVHQSMSAIDFVPLRPIDRSSLIRRLCSEHQLQGPRFHAGLGFYTRLRFHVDSWRYRTWGRHDSGEAACPRVTPTEPTQPVLASAPPTKDAPGRTAAPYEQPKDPLAPL